MPSVSVFEDPSDPSDGPFDGLAAWYRESGSAEAHSARQEINERYAKFPDRSGMVLSRLRGAEDLEIQQATDELYVHSLLSNAYEAAYEEDATSPDFRLYRSSEYVAGIEVLTLFPDKLFSTEFACNSALIQEINRRIRLTNWYVSIGVEKWDRQPSVADVVR